MPTESIGSASCGTRTLERGALAVAGSVASLGGLKDEAGELEGVKGCLCTDEGNGAIDPDDDEGLRVAPLSKLPRTNFCRGMFGGGGGFTLRVFSATVEVGATFGGLRLVLI